MKKSLVVALAAAFVFSVAGSAFAAANPFVDVPANHWAYAAVTNLAKAGLVDGMGDGTFQGNKEMTRYEMAQIVAKAMTKVDKADAANKALIEKLEAEFASELDNLGVRVSALEKKTDNFKVTGSILTRFEGNKLDDGEKYYVPSYKDKTIIVENPGAATSTKTVKSLDNNEPTRMIRSELTFSGAINSDWTYKARLRNEQMVSNGPRESATNWRFACVEGPVAGAKVTAGSFLYLPAYGLMADSQLDGIKVGFGNQLKANVYYGREFKHQLTTVDGKKGLVSTDVGNLFTDKMYTELGAPGAKSYLVGTDSYKTTLTGLELAYALDKKTNLKGFYAEAKAQGADANADFTQKYWEAGFDRQLGNDWALMGVYGGSDADTQDKAYVAGVTYKAAKIAEKGSYGAWANYSRREALSTIDSTYGPANILDGEFLGVHGAKGYEVGFSYVPATNIQFNAKYVDLKATDDSNLKEKRIRADFNFVF